MNKNHKLITWSVMIILILSGLTALIYSSYITYSVEEIDVMLDVGDSIKQGKENGLNLGTIPPGSRVERTLRLSHEYSKPLIAHVSAYRDIADWASMEKNDILIEPGDSVKSKIIFHIPPDIEKGSYSGKIKIYFKRT
ncbi:hypothetical protein GF336_05910 [Candidatus Woesearchaeota archaeon]|nr:hypothetical protein [Candidatus Woesearchaeota archaeon]